MVGLLPIVALHVCLILYQVLLALAKRGVEITSMGSGEQRETSQERSKKENKFINIVPNIFFVLFHDSNTR